MSNCNPEVIIDLMHKVGLRENYVRTGICGYIESVRFGDYRNDFEYPLTEGERWE